MFGERRGRALLSMGFGFVSWLRLRHFEGTGFPRLVQVGSGEGLWIQRWGR